MRRKHIKDKNHGKNGWVGGNPRYRDSRGSKPKNRKFRTMGRN